MRQYHGIAFFLITGFLLSLGACGASSKDILGPVLSKYQLPAMGYAVVKKDKILALDVKGSRIFGQDIPVQTNDVFHWGSCTKSVTAFLAMVLVQEGVIRLDTTLGEVFTNYSLNPKMKTITLEQLLSHTAGLPRDYYTRKMQRGLDKIKDPVAGRKFTLKNTLSHAPVFRSGYHYSNLGFNLAGAMLEQAAGRSYEQLVLEKVFTPLGMSTATFDGPTDPHKITKPVGHTYAGTPKYSDLPSAYNSSGRLQTSMGDFALYARFILQGLTRGQSLVKQDLFLKLFTPHQENYCLGWEWSDQPWAGGRIYSHDGSNGLNFARILILPQRQLAIVEAVNREEAASVHELTDILLKKYSRDYRKLNK